jgi:hypothetical protein
MQSEIVDPGVEEARESIGGRFHDRIPLHVERSVQQHRETINRLWEVHLWECEACGYTFKTLVSFADT